MAIQDTSELETILGFHFQNKELLREALTHRSYLNENPKWPSPHNERLEYLGDAALELAASEELFRMFPRAPEGELTVLRAALVNYQLLSRVAKEIRLDEFIYMSKGEKADTAKAREVILANAIEAVIGAMYLDQGFEATKRFIVARVMSRLDEILKTKSYRDSKSALQELVQDRMRLTPTYRVLEETGPAHRRVFIVGVYFGDKRIAQGSGSSKQEAEVAAAKEALQDINS